VHASVVRPVEADLTRVLVVEDDSALRRALHASLEADGYAVEEAAGSDEARSVFSTFRPDVVILDVRLPGEREGFELGREIRSAGETAIIFLTAVDGVDERLQAFALGADDYLAKPFSMAELLARTRAVLRRSRRLVAGRLVVRDLEIDLESGAVYRGGERLNLTDTELRLLVALARAPGRVLSKQQLLADVWEFDAYDVNLVEVHMSALRRKLEAAGERLIFTERARGYVMRP
jgi:two-component system OmpR family response regulator